MSGPKQPRWWAPGWIALASALLALAACSREEVAPDTGSGTTTKKSDPTFVGSAACASCHPQETARWQGSHHDRALQAATPSSVLGRFDGSAITHFGVETRFRREGDRYVVRTDGPDGSVQDFEVTETFGVDPLQQYLVELPGGRKQALPFAWDARPEGKGGQRWIHLHPEEALRPNDPLHWTNVAGNWNHQCAECHSTQVRKGWDAKTERYDTTFSEEDVGCEACHGPGSAHVAWAGGARRDPGVAGDSTKGLVFRIGAGDGGTWVRAESEPIARRSVKRTSSAEIETCARCHSRRSVLREDYVHGRPILETHRVALLDEELYFADGQIQDEVYEYGSFLQSRMHAAGVTCSDCHDPHGLRLREEGNALCGQCHAAEVFDTPAHHHHPAGSDATRCVACHAPTRTYMRVDDRHDHSFRVPHPDLSVANGTPNACTGCHAKRSPRWAAEAVARWRGSGAPPRAHFGSALHAGRSGARDAEESLVALADDASQPAIARATAVRLLGTYLSVQSLPVLERSLSSDEPLLRLAAAGAAAALPPPQRLALLRPLLRDPVRAVRLEAVEPLLGVPVSHWSPGERAALADVLAEYRAAHALAADQPEGQLSLGNLHALLGEHAAALERYDTAIRLAPWAIPPRLNRADLLRALGREEEAEATLREALARAPESADAHYALGLALVRQKRMPEAVSELERAASLAPEFPRYAMTLALALESVGEKDRASKVLAEARAKRPGDPMLADPQAP